MPELEFPRWAEANRYGPIKQAFFAKTQAGEWKHPEFRHAVATKGSYLRRSQLMRQARDWGYAGTPG